MAAIVVSSGLVSVEEYFAEYESVKPAVEYIDGLLYPKPMATTDHSYIQARLIVLFVAKGLRACPELTLPLTPAKFLVPDVVANKTGLARPYPTEPVYLCVEIISPSQQGRPGKRPGELLAKCEHYHQWGVPYCWVVDPEKRTAYEYHRDGTVEQQMVELRAGDVSIPVAEIFAVLDE